MIRSKDIIWHHATVTRKQRNEKNKHKSFVIWFTGLSGSGKSTLAHAVEAQLYERGCSTFVLDGDNIRHGLCSDLGFDVLARRENIRRIGEISKLFIESGIIVLASFISPFKEDREKVRRLFANEEFLEIYCQCKLEICEIRDTKGLYACARSGKIKDFTGIDSPYECPENPELILQTDQLTLEKSVSKVIKLLNDRTLIPDTKILK